MFRCHSTRLLSAQRDANLRPSLSCTSFAWQKLSRRNIAYGSSTPSLSPEHDIYISASTDPFFNLTLEDWYVVVFLELDYVSIKLLTVITIPTHAPATCVQLIFFIYFSDIGGSPSSSPLLLIYRNSPCVIIGRNQNSWTEVNFTPLHAARIPFIRRRSGGGTVYHVSFNWCFNCVCFEHFLDDLRLIAYLSFVTIRISGTRTSHYIFPGIHLTDMQLVNWFFEPCAHSGLMHM